MILTGPEIERQVAAERICIDPYDPQNVGPNSVDLRLYGDLRVYEDEILDMGKDNPTRPIGIPASGRVLKPGRLYLGRTKERIHSDHYVPMVTGRSSVGRLGLHVHVTAGLCDTGFNGTITLELMATQPIRVYADRRICQVTFSAVVGDIRLYEGRYQGQEDVTASRMHIGRGK